ncbi:hypothetical protein [Streptomyces pactum]|uniref:Uncharacterized protein n=1 Tax=Streptomyces pactum TaxID=68249 RepID=A0A1S6J7I3_9ACTN|nr:hypothetical protein [Streptomyces pactum]AQS67706.1 hypothetical protein B1H29_12940 [Streptomyces pactum]
MTIAPHSAPQGASHLYRAHAVFDPRTGTGAVFTDIHATPDGPRYATRKDFVYGEEVTVAEWTIPTDGLPRYEDEHAAS